MHYMYSTYYNTMWPLGEGRGGGVIQVFEYFRRGKAQPLAMQGHSARGPNVQQGWREKARPPRKCSSNHYEYIHLMEFEKCSVDVLVVYIL